MMKRNCIVAQMLLFIGSLLLPLLVQAKDTQDAKSDFVLAVFATKRARADLLDKTNNQNILSYNVNWESQVDLENNCIRNVWTRANGRWVRVETVPLPDVVYDFGVYKNDHNRKEKANLLKEQLRSQNIPFINPEDGMNAVNDKILFAKLMRDNDIPHPKTRELTKSNLKKMLDKYDLLFIKPTFGSKGYGIIVVEKVVGTEKARYSLKYKIKYQGQWVVVRYSNLPKNKVFETITKAKLHLKRGGASYLVQQGIKIFLYHGQQTDFRLNVQRGQNGELLSTGITMRVGGNVSQGGRPARHEDVLSSSGLFIDTVKARLINVAMKTHYALEKFGGKPIGDLGHDLVIDDNGNPYIVEANDKAGYGYTHIQKNPDIDQLFGLPSALEHCKKTDEDHENQILEYARYLAAASKK